MTNYANQYNSSEKLKHISCSLQAKLSWLHQSFRFFLRSLLQTLLLQVNSFCIELSYFITISLLGFLSLKASKPRTNTISLKNFDLFFTSVSAVTVSSMVSIEMEVFSNTQLVLMTIMMFLGGEVFTSMLGLLSMRAKNIYKSDKNINSSYHGNESDTSSDSNTGFDNCIEPENTVTGRPDENKPETRDDHRNLKQKSVKTLAYLVSGYLLAIHVVGSTLISVYLSLIPSARKVLTKKGLNMQTFSIFTTVSTFANCGFVPTNENMMVFKKNSGLLLILISQVLMGNTLYPVFLRLSIWVMGKVSKRGEFSYMLKNSGKLGYGHLISGVRCVYLAITVLGFIVLQFVVFCLLEWNSEAISGGMSGFEKFVGSLFQVVNSRHAGESVFDLSAISPAILVLFVIMMYLPPYTSYLPIEEAENISSENNSTITRKKSFWEKLLFSQLSYLSIFVILICITERHKMKRDPLNFNVLNIVLEVISAYGNVGFSVGYSCERQINQPDNEECVDAWTGFSGRWSNQGKFVLIVVMFFGRLKKFTLRGGRAWLLA